MEFSKSELLLMGFVASLVTIIIVLIGKVGIYNQTGCWGECSPECSERKCAVEINPHNLNSYESSEYHEIPEPGTLFLMGSVLCGLGIQSKMRG